MDSSKRKRGNNYTEAERVMLLDIVKAHQDILENKLVNSQMIKLKKYAWNKVAEEFNSVASSGHRTWLQLRRFYENYKHRSKTNVAKKKDTVKMDNKDMVDPSILSERGDLESDIESDEGKNISEFISLKPKGLDSESEEENTNTQEFTNFKPKGEKKITMEEKYFHMKLENAKLERKLMLERHKLEIHLIKLKIKGVSKLINI